MSEVVIVGSGRSLLGSGLGEKIDSFENIIRFNGADDHLEEFQADTGLRTTIFTFNTNIKTLRLVDQKIKDAVFDTTDISEFYMTSGNAYIHPVKYLRKSKAGRNIYDFLQTDQIPWRLFSHNTARDALKKLDLDSKRFSMLSRRRRAKHRFWAFTSGLIVLCNIIDMYDKIYLCGFDWLAEKGEWYNESLRGHFYDDVKLPFKRHHLGGESKLIKRLIDRTGKIEVLK